MSDTRLAVVLLLAAAVSLAMSWLLVSRLKRVGMSGRFGRVGRVAADAPDITAGVTALAGP